MKPFINYRHQKRKKKNNKVAENYLGDDMSPLLSSVHSTSWKLRLYFVYTFIADWNFLTEFCGFDPSFNRNILASLYLKSETSPHAHTS